MFPAEPRRAIAAATFVLMTTLAGTNVVAAPINDPIARRIERMSLRAKVGQLVMFSVGGLGLTEQERDVIRASRLGGVILFSKNYSDRSQLARLTAQIQRAARGGRSDPIGALISVDQEGGVVKRFPDMAPWRSAPQMRDAEPSVAYEQGRLAGGALRSVGVNVDLAPVADLDLPPSHVMRSRSFGSRPVKVARRVTRFARGLQSRRTAAAAKHFPGLGGATMNTDDGRAYVYRSRWQLRRIDAVPFHHAIDAGMKVVMLSHAIYPNDGGARPASVDRDIATRRLRDGFGFEGVAISDALEAVAWRFDGDTARACRATVWAGVDIALITGGVGVARSCARAIRQGVEAGAISMTHLDRSVARVLELKAWLGVFDP